MKALLATWLINPILDRFVDSGLFTLERIDRITEYRWGRRLLGNSLSKRHHRGYHSRLTNQDYWSSEDSVWWHFLTKMDPMKTRPLQKLLSFIAEQRLFKESIRVADIGSGLMRSEIIFKEALNVARYDKFDINPHVVRLQRFHNGPGVGSECFDLLERYRDLKGYDIVVFVYGVLMYFSPETAVRMLDEILLNNGAVLVSGEGHNSDVAGSDSTLTPSDRQGDMSWMHDFRHLLSEHDIVFCEEKNILVFSRYSRGVRAQSGSLLVAST